MIRRRLDASRLERLCSPRQARTREAGAAETVETAMGPVRAFRARVAGRLAEMPYGFSEAEPRWEVRAEVPGTVIVIEARSRAA